MTTASFRLRTLVFTSALSLGLAFASVSFAEHHEGGQNPCAAKANPCAAKTPPAKANPCAAKTPPAKANPCAAKTPPAKANPCNPCAGK